MTEEHWVVPEVLPLDDWIEPEPLDFDGFHDRAVKWAVNRFHGKGTEVMCGYFVLAGKGMLAIMHVPWKSESEKYRVAYVVRQMLAHNRDIEAYSFITEAWARTPPKDEKYERNKPVRMHDDKEDVLQIFTTHRDDRFTMTRFGVRYYLNNRKPPRLLERDDHHMPAGSEIVGAMHNFFVPYDEMERRIEAAWKRYEDDQKG